MSELAEPRKALEEAGAKTALIARKAGKIQAMKHHDKASEFDVDMTLEQAKPQDFDAVLLPGGALNADALRMEAQAQKFVREINESGNRLP
jgi:protease I